MEHGGFARLHRERDPLSTQRPNGRKLVTGPEASASSLAVDDRRRDFGLSDRRIRREQPGANVRRDHWFIPIIESVTGVIEDVTLLESDS